MKQMYTYLEKHLSRIFWIGIFLILVAYFLDLMRYTLHIVPVTILTSGLHESLNIAGFILSFLGLFVILRQEKAKRDS